MASLTITSGGSQPVFATDTLNGPQLAATTTYTPAGRAKLVNRFGFSAGNRILNNPNLAT